MDITEARELLSRAVVDRNEALAAELLARRTIESAELMIRSLTIRFPELDEKQLVSDQDPQPMPTSDLSPRGAEAVLRVLQVNENKDFNVADMVTALAERKWLPDSTDPANAVRTALERLLNSDTPGVKKIKRQGTVVYRFNEPIPPKEAEHTST